MKHKFTIEHEDYVLWESLKPWQKIQACHQPDSPLWWSLAAYGADSPFKVSKAPALLKMIRRQTKKGNMEWIVNHAHFEVHLHCSIWLIWAVHWKYTHSNCLGFIIWWLSENQITGGKYGLLDKVARHPRLDLPEAKILKDLRIQGLENNDNFMLWILEDIQFIEKFR